MNLKDNILSDLKKNPDLKTGFFEFENRWNNSFNFYEWKKIFIPWIKICDLKNFEDKILWWDRNFWWDEKIFENLKFWEKIVFEEINASKEDCKQERIKEVWFEDHFWILNKKWFPPIFICDNHNHVLESWKFFKWENTKLIHIDQHYDNANYKKPIKNFRRDLRICDYIDYAIDEKWIDKNYISLCENSDFEKYFEKNFFSNWKDFSDSEKIFLEFEKKLGKKNKKIILNIDLDIFVDYQTLINHKKIFALIKFLKNKVDLISIASSPIFLKKEKVFWLLKEIFAN